MQVMKKEVIRKVNLPGKKNPSISRFDSDFGVSIMEVKWYGLTFFEGIPSLSKGIWQDLV